MSDFNKILSIQFFLLAFVFVSAVSIGAQGATDSPVKLFQGRNASGAKQDIPPGTYRVDGKQPSASSTNEADFSVQVAKGYRIRFCEDQGTSGKGEEKCEEYGQGTHNLQSSKFTSIRVWKETAPAATPVATPPVIVYEQLNWGGRSQIFLPGMYRSDRGEFGRINDNMAMSVVVSKGFHARFCEEEGISARGSGDCEEHDEGRHNLRFSNIISFIEVIDLSDQSPDDDTMPVVLYEDRSQGGKRQGFDVGVFIASLNQLGKVGDDQASSVAVKNGYRVLICSDEPTDGGRSEKCEEFGAGKHNLRLKDTASYLKVSKGEK